jgi:NAD+ synthase
MDLLKINAAEETARITSFIKSVFKTQGIKNVIIGLSGGIDSAVCLSLLQKSIPGESVFVAHLYYFESQINSMQTLFKKTNIPPENIQNISIKSTVDEVKKTLGLIEDSSDYRVRLGNIMARTRMTILYDLAKKHRGLVCGTENKSEHLLGYFTRFGDEASDLEPIKHLYKTQVYQLSKYLGLPKRIIDLPPTAGLWRGQTDESDFGFSYKEADCVLNLYFDRKKPLSEIISGGFVNAEKIIDRMNDNSFKHRLPYAP